MLEKSIYSFVRQVVTGREHIRVAVIGSKESGKTVFLTALTDHLRNHDPNLLNLNGWSVVCRKYDNENMGKIPLFQYSKARDQLSRGEWPDNTTSLSAVQLKLRLEKGDGKEVQRRNVILELLDLPGERIADLSMAGRSFREWCEWLEVRFCGAEGYSPHYVEYVERVKDMADARSILAAYKACVVKQYGDGLLTITPSVLKLTTNKEFIVGESVSEYRKNIDSACIGVDENSQFAPLPSAFFDKRSAGQRSIVKAFKKAYEEYKSRIVEPITGWLSHVNKVVYLVDVLALLYGGPETYNAERDFAEQALRMFRRSFSDRKPIRGVQRLLGAFVRTHADGVYVVATKADMVVGEKNHSRMKDLALRMMKPALSSLGLSVNQWKVRSCASVLTTDEFAAEKALMARVQVGKDKSGDAIVEKIQYYVNDVPMYWPDSSDWMRGDKRYEFPPTFPKFDKKSDRPPPQLGLDKVIVDLLSLF